MLMGVKNVGGDNIMRTWRFFACYLTELSGATYVKKFSPTWLDSDFVSKTESAGRSTQIQL